MYVFHVQTKNRIIQENSILKTNRKNIYVLLYLSRFSIMSESNSCPEDPRVQIEELNKKMIEAAGSGDHEGVSRALGEGAEITCKDWAGRTGLHIGALKGHDNVVLCRYYYSDFIIIFLCAISFIL